MTESSPSPATASPRRRPRFSTIFWGLVLLTFAVYMLLESIMPGALDPVFWLLGSVIMLGVILVVTGIVAATARRAD